MPGHPFPGDWIGGGSTKQVRANRLNPSIADFCNKIGHEQTNARQRTEALFDHSISPRE